MRAPWPISKLLTRRAERDSAHQGVGRTTLVDYRLNGVGIELIDRYYQQIGFPRNMPAGNYAHLVGKMDDEIVLIGLWSSDRAARQMYTRMRPVMDAVIAEAGPGASIERQSHPTHRFLFGAHLAEFREDRAALDPDCVGYVIDLPINDHRAYDLICEHMDFPRDYPDGLLLHVASRAGDRWRVTSVWREVAQSREFLEQRLMPAAVAYVRDHGVFPEIRPRELRVHLFAVNKRLIDAR